MIPRPPVPASAASVPDLPPVQASAATTLGRIRSTNEDRHLLDLTNGWFAIADGIGGLPYGERASECAIRQLIREIARPGSDTRPLPEIVAACHQAVRQLGAVLAPRTGIGTTFTCLRLQPALPPPSEPNPFASGLQALGVRIATLAHIGDSAAYLHPARSHRFLRLTTDHTIPVPPVRIVGHTSTPFQAPPRLDRYLGQPAPPVCDVHSFEVAPLDRLILCSDGVTRALDESELATLSTAQASPATLVRALVHIADLRGGLDNATALALDLT